MEAVQLHAPPSIARRRFSDSYGAGVADRRRRSLIALEHPSVLESLSNVGGDATGAKTEVPKAKQERRVSVLARQASSMSRFFALSSTSKSFQKERILATKVNALLFLDDPNPNVDTLRRTVGGRLLDIPRFRCVVRGGEKGSVVFEPLARSDVRLEEHIVHIDGRDEFGPTDMEELINEAYLSKWHAGMPLWRMTIVTHLGDGRSLLFAAIDHAIGDGVGLLSVLLSLFDDYHPNSEEGSEMNETSLQKKKRTTRRTPRGLSLSHRAVAFLNGMRVGIVHCLSPPPSDPHHALMIPKDVLSEPCRGKSFAQTRAFSLEEIRTMKKKLDGATVNDVLVGLLAMAIAKYLEMKKDEAIDLVRRGRGAIRAGFPVNMRRGTDAGNAGLGNNVVVGYISLPVDCHDPIDFMWRAKTRLDELKISPAFTLSKWITDAIFPTAPDTVLAERMLDVYNRCTCMVSNVIGPSDAASIAGYHVSDLNFTGAHPGNLYIGVLSFAGRLRVSGLLDRKAEGNVEELMDCFEHSYDELRGALYDVDENEPLERPNMTPRSARFLELLMCMMIVAVCQTERFPQIFIVTMIIALPLYAASKYEMI